ncbi:MAG TPA: undecaprenyldiphospho-muramoylpentapeptide beta-N-acetylglucosaminyltransferase [Candidatus Baltobacteraceae bacterium]|nr:undecaprenyldiphospho-muramoylpentapeptide beta-N-acetylglucosaminyltransferase [Candidatus Baltobacteraceae bacterium]
MTVVFAGGGTGGHLYPAIAIADALRERGAAIAFVGTADRLEATIVPKAGYELHAVRSRPLVRKFSLALVATIAANFVGCVQSALLLRRLRPQMLIATGGYVCFPVVLAARVLRGLRAFDGAIALVEPNAHPGLTNRLLAPWVDEVWGAFEPGDARFAGKYVATGVPVRASLRALPPRDVATAQLGLSPERKTLLAIGGSQGARTINDALVGLLKRRELPSGWQVIHVTGEREYDRVRGELGNDGASVRPYLHDLADAYAAADLVLARAGASTLSELAAVGKPAVLVPYPHAADDHQSANAQRFAAGGAAIVVSDRDLAAGRLRAVLDEAAAPSRLAALQAAAAALRRGDAVATILARVDLLTGRRSPS